MKAAALINIHLCLTKKTQREVHTSMYNKDDDSSRVCASARIQEVRPAFTTIQCGREKVVGPSAFIHTNRIESQISFIVDRNRKTARRRSFNEMYRIVTIASARARGRQLGRQYVRGTLPRMTELHAPARRNCSPRSRCGTTRENELPPKRAD